MGDLGSEEVEQQPLEGLHYMGCQSNWSIIIQFSRVRFLSSWDQAQRFPQPRHPPQPQTQVEHMLEGRIKLCSTYLQHFGAHFVWACRLDGGASVHTCAAWWDWSKGGHLSGVMEVEMWGGTGVGDNGKNLGEQSCWKTGKTGLLSEHPPHWSTIVLFTACNCWMDIYLNSERKKPAVAGSCWEAATAPLGHLLPLLKTSIKYCSLTE